MQKEKRPFNFNKSLDNLVRNDKKNITVNANITRNKHYNNPKTKNLSMKFSKLGKLVSKGVKIEHIIYLTTFLSAIYLAYKTKSYLFIFKGLNKLKGIIQELLKKEV